MINHMMRNPCNNKAVRGKCAILAGYLSMHRICCKRERSFAEWLIKYIGPKILIKIISYKSISATKIETIEIRIHENPYILLFFLNTRKNPNDIENKERM